MISMDYRIPGSLKTEHESLYEGLNRAARVQGAVGDAAILAFKLFEPHIRKEEEFALPELDVLQPLARKEQSIQELSGVLKLCDKLQRQMAVLLEEHDLIRKPLQQLNDVAMKEEKPEYAALAKALIQHLDREEQILYPAAILVGEYVRLKLYGPPVAATR
jgi:iron-sulfur cluster repair protein YtfE (RIC family)